MMVRILLLLLALILSGCKVQEAPKKVQEAPQQVSVKPKGTECIVKRVVDGDTFVCVRGNEEIKVRLIGVDTPESSANQKAYRDSAKTGQSLDEIIKMGQEAKKFTSSILKPGTKVYLETDVQPTDKYGRLLAYVWLEDGRMLNEILIREGYAQVYTIPPNVKYAEHFLEAQRKAREERKGFWGR